MYNVAEVKTNRLMLGRDVHDYIECLLWVEYYRQHYGDGVPFFNGKGYHDGEFAPVVYDEQANEYRILH